MHIRTLLLLALVAVTPQACAPKAKEVRPNHPLPQGLDTSRAEPGRRGGVFIDSTPGEPSTFNPLVSEDATSSGFIGLFLDSLVHNNPVTQEVEPGLASRWEIAPDNKTFTFHLRPGVRWSDGHPFTADDVVFTFQAIYDPRFPNRAAFDLSVDGKKFSIEKVDDFTVRLSTPEIYAPFLETVGGVGLLPKHELEPAFRDGSLLKAWNVSIAQKEPRRLLATGAFRLRSYQPAERIVFEANPHYWRADAQGVRLPYVDFLVTKLVKDANASTLAFATGQTDAEGLSPDNVAWIDRYASATDSPFLIAAPPPIPASSGLIKTPAETPPENLSSLPINSLGSPTAASAKPSPTASIERGWFAGFFSVVASHSGGPKLPLTKNGTTPTSPSTPSTLPARKSSSLRPDFNSAQIKNSVTVWETWSNSPSTPIRKTNSAPIWPPLLRKTCETLASP